MRFLLIRTRARVVAAFGATAVAVAVAVAVAAFGLAALPRSRVPLASPSSPEERARIDAVLRRAARLTREAEASLAHGDIARAEELYLKAVSVDPHDPVTRLALAQFCEQRGELQAALAEYYEIVYQPWGGFIGSDPVTMMHYVLAPARAKQWPEADLVFRAAHLDGLPKRRLLMSGQQQTPAPSERVDMVAAAHQYLGSHGFLHKPVPWAERMGHLEAALELRPNWASLHQLRASLLMKDR